MSTNGSVFVGQLVKLRPIVNRPASLSPLAPLASGTWPVQARLQPCNDPSPGRLP